MANTRRSVRRTRAATAAASANRKRKSRSYNAVRFRKSRAAAKWKQKLALFDSFANGLGNEQVVHQE